MKKVLIVGGFVDQLRYQGAGSSHINPTKLEEIKDVIASYTQSFSIAKGYSLETDKVDEKMVF